MDARTESANRRLDAAREYISREYANELRLADLAGCAFMSEAHFVRQFGRRFGTTPYRYLLDCRLAAARRLLVETSFPVGRVVEEAGFGNRSSFSRAFKERYGLSPHHYRSMMRRRQGPKRVNRYAAAALSALLILSVAPVMAGSVKAEAKKAPCSTPQHRQFDFWVGDWEVFSKDKLAGHNRIELLHGGCVLKENWSSASGQFSGSSLNLYDAARGQWHQSWTDSSGTLLQLDGGWQDGSMVLRGERPGSNGQPVEHEIRWTPRDDGTVRQLWKVSASGQSQILFDGIYRKSDR